MNKKLLETLRELREVAYGVSEDRPEELALLADADEAIQFVEHAWLKASDAALHTLKAAGASELTLEHMATVVGLATCRTSVDPVKSVEAAAYFANKIGPVLTTATKQQLLATAADCCRPGEDDFSQGKAEGIRAAIEAIERESVTTAHARSVRQPTESITSWIDRLGERIRRGMAEVEAYGVLGSHGRYMYDLGREAIDYAEWLRTTPTLPPMSTLPRPETAVPTLTLPADLHADTAALVLRFANAMGDKLAAAQRKRGLTNEWSQTDWMDQCRSDLVRHVAKGDPRDVAIYAAFLWHHGEPSALPAKARPDLELVVTTDELGECCAITWQDEDTQIREVVWERAGGDARPTLSGYRKDARVMCTGDMGEGRQLVLFREDDGDIIVCITPVGHKFSEEDVQFCTPFGGGGKSPATHAALQRLWHAMHLDSQARIHTTQSAPVSEIGQ